MLAVSNLGLPLELVLLQKQENEGVKSGQRRYSSLMKQFAHTLYFYSQKHIIFQENILSNLIAEQLGSG